MASALPGAPVEPPGLYHPPDIRGTSAAEAGTSYAEEKTKEKKIKDDALIQQLVSRKT